MKVFIVPCLYCEGMIHTNSRLLFHMDDQPCCMVMYIIELMLNEFKI